MTVWLLSMWLGYQVLVPGIESEAECKRLADVLTYKGTTFEKQYKCIPYRGGVNNP